MSDGKMASLPLRLASGIAAGSLFLGVGYCFGSQGLIIAVALVILGACFEFSQIAFARPGIPGSLKFHFLLLAAAWLALTLTWPQIHEIGIALAFGLFVVLTLIGTRNRVPNDRLLMLMGEGAVGFLYCLVLPSYAIALLKLDMALHWFAYLLLVVFSGDTAAYFGGILLGKSKLIEQVSPKKTWAGSISGLIGSALVSLVFALYLLPELSPPRALILGLACGVFAQAGDLLASLIKRVGDVKDSGRIMPGHGGVLDRIDGVFLACPLVYWAAAL